jgi:polysaccharide pyruvyl transferase WcaK-like protein
MFIVPGTGFLVDHTTGPYGYPYYVFKWSVIAKLCRCKLLFVSMGAGPIYHPLSKWFIKSALSLADYRSYRDNFSKQYIDSIGFNTNGDPVYPDLAFSLPGSIMPECNDRDRQRPVIGIGLIDYHGPSDSLRNGVRENFYRDYIGKLATFITWFLDNKYTVRVLIGDVKYDSSVKQGLLELLEKRGIKYEDGQFINEPIFTEEQLLPQLVDTDIVVSPRFHNVILALMLNKPVLSISYNEKFDYLMSGLGLEEYCHHIDHLDVDRLIEQFIKLEENAENLKPCIKKKTEEYRRTLDEQYTFIFNDMWTE